MNFSPCKITVIKKDFNEELVNKYLKKTEKMKICTILEENQEFLVTNPYIIPEKMCASAWADIRSYIITMAAGGEFDFMIDPKTALAICSDPFRPIIFKIERLEKNNINNRCKNVS